MAEENKQPNIAPPSNVHAVIKRAVEIYEGLKAQLEPAQNGRYVAIEVESGEHFLGDTREEAVKLSKAKYPDRITFTRKIGEGEKTSRHSSWERRHRKYAGVL